MTKPHEHLDSVAWEAQTEDGNVLLSPSWEVFVLGVSILSVFNIFFLLVIRNPDLDQVVLIMDGLLTFVFLADLARRLVIAKDYRAYLVKGGWIDALSVFPGLRIFRLLRVIRIIRVLNGLGGPETSLRAIFSNKAAGGLLTVVLIALLVMEFGSLAILAVERGHEGANIESATDAVWYLIVTMSTVGYGDRFPVTDLGRLIGSLIIVVGVGVFGTLTGFLANLFLSPRDSEIVAVATSSPPADGSSPDVDASGDDDSTIDSDAAGGEETGVTQA